MATVQPIAVLLLASFAFLMVHSVAGMDDAEPTPETIITVPTDGGWAPWSYWSPCTKACEWGEQTRSRCCTPPAYASNVHTACQGNVREVQPCNRHLCPIHGNWGNWGAFSSCTLPCDRGTQSRTRVCNNPPPSRGGRTCAGSNVNGRPCNTHPCGSGSGEAQDLDGAGFFHGGK